ncbi:MAG: family 20 glycosylhydrolase [Calditrichaeota bacterium]|nr:family 20 glycosylhydrolase [Calditrichota bacterium]
MKITLITVFLIFQFIMAQETPLKLMPYPGQVNLKDGNFRLNEQFIVSTNGSINERLNFNTTRFLRRLSGRTGLFFPQDYITSKKPEQNAHLVINVARQGKLELGEDEAYEIVVSPKNIKISAETDFGAKNALETLLQLMEADKDGYYFPAVEIKDKPRFKWRGLLIDAGRHFMPVDVIKRNLDGMSAVKMNVLHWHLSEDQGFRVESRVYPKLHELGSDGKYYTQEQIKDIVAYAAMLGIRVVPEFDVPGHVTSWLTAYPELASVPGPYSIERKFGVFVPALNPAQEFTYTFLDNFFGEMVTLFPDKFFHIGGDEVWRGDEHQDAHWNINKDIVAFKKQHNFKDNSALQNYFNQRVEKILEKYDRVMIGWDEILHDSMPENIVIQSWRGKEAMIKAAKRGVRSLLSNGYYIDLIYPAKDHYLNDPLPDDVDLTDDQKQMILGGEATMWAEYISPETIDSRVWPRTAAIAERFWSPGYIKDVNDMYRRLEYISYQLEELGLTHIKNPEMMMRRLLQNQSIAPLKTFTSVVEPLKGYQRGQKRIYTTFSPLTRVVDIATPDARVAREFNDSVDAFLLQPDKETAQKLEKQLNCWQENHKKLSELSLEAPAINEILPLSESLSKLAGQALVAVKILNSEDIHNTLKPDSELFQNARTSYGQVELAVVTSIEKLIKAASALK